ncbi:hypothetical protein [uncultured Flavonifractor sp.]|uniref:hypothetical protein n=1 Tax=uncultured Flavonifractor sp. TaxID=1193534 RepID=UPI00263A2B00|nr:hypothetical protein [uncultured Flavonifractor sp.]
MKTLMIPCLGRKIVNGIPQYLNRHPNGRLLIERSIEGVFSETYEKVLIILLASDVQDYGASSIIKKELESYPAEIVVLDEMTTGPAETVYQAIKKMHITGPLVIKDSDNFLRTGMIPTGNFVAGLNLNTWDRDIHNLRNKSFLIINEQGNLLDIIEKQVRSDAICLGLYGFQKAEDFAKAYEQLNDGSYPISKLYISHVISYLIGYSERVFHYVPALEYENWGDERLWEDMQRDYTMYFIDLDNVLGCGGTLSENNKEKLSVLQDRGATFVGYTVENETYKISALKVLQNAGLKFIKIIYGCPYSERKEMITSEADLEKKVIEL